MFLKMADWPSTDTAARLKVEWVSSLARLAHHFKWGPRQRIVLQFNKLINVIWQVVSSALGGSRHGLQSHLIACSITMLTKAWTGTEKEITGDDWDKPLWYSRSATSKVKLKAEGSPWTRHNGFLKKAHLIGAQRESHRINTRSEKNMNNYLRNVIDQKHRSVQRLMFLCCNPWRNKLSSLFLHSYCLRVVCW